MPSNTLGATGLNSTATGYATTASGQYSITMGNGSQATGITAVAMGLSTQATGPQSFTMGLSTDATGSESVALGNLTLATGPQSTAVGFRTIANGDHSLAGGERTTAESSHSVAFGRYNVGGGTVDGWVETDPIFEIGNGTNSANLSNVLTVLKNGTVTAPSFDLAEITDDKALITKEYADINLVGTGLEKITEAVDEGWRLSGADPANYGNIGLNAIDLSQSVSASTTMGATGNFSFGVGLMARASGLSSIAIGNETEALGNWATSIGRNNLADGSSSVALGQDTEALGNFSLSAGRSTKAIADYAVSLGFYTEVDAYSSTAIGSFNVGGGTIDSWVDTDPIFEIGNGTTPGSLSNALTVLKNGTVTAPSFDLAEITDDKALITKEYADTNLVGSGLEQLDEGNGNGWRLIGADPANYGNLGENSIDLSISDIPSTSYGATGLNSTASGYATTASGQYSTAMGAGSLASGQYSTAMGEGSHATGLHAVAMGWISQATGSESVAMGQLTIASGLQSLTAGFRSEAIGDHSLAVGERTKAASSHSVALGRNNVGGGTPDEWIETDPLFEIGNGMSFLELSNALTILKNGKVGIGEENPSGFLEVKAVNTGGEPNLNLIHEGTTGARINFSNTDTTNGNLWTIYGDSNDTDANSVFNIYHPNAPNGGNILQLRGDGQIGINGTPDTEFHVHHGGSGSTDGFKLENLGANANWWRLYTVNSTGNLNLFSKSQGATSVGNFNDVSGAYTSTSDRRLKKNFEDLYFKWNEFMKLKTLTYEYKAEKDGTKHIGLVAQDVEPIYPELVNYNSDEDVYHLNYAGFGVVAIKAIQEQQKIITEQASRIEELETKLSKNENRLNKVEALLNIK